jgi:glyoxylate/hydroxypyruvate reductase
MTMLFCHETIDPDPWLREFRAHDPALEVRLWPHAGALDEIEAIFALRLPADLSGPFSNLAFVQCFGTGADHLLADPRIPAHIPIARLVNSQQTQGMVEFVLGIVLGWHRRFDTFRAQQRRGEWRRHPHPLASERTVGVLGLGEIGGAVASSLAGFGFNTRGWSRSSRILPGVRTFAGEAGLDAFAAGLDCIVCLLPLTGSTRHVLSAGLFGRLAPNAYVVNVGRGGHCKEDDLLAAIGSGQLAGAWLDVFETEPLPATSSLWHHDNITISPHAGTMSRAETAAASIIDNLHRVRRGEPIHHAARAANPA